MSLDLIFPSGKEVTVAGEPVTVKPFMFGQFPEATRLLQPVVAAIANRGLLVVGDDGIQISPNWPLLITGVVSEIGEDVLALCGFVTGKDRSFFDTVAMDEGANLLLAIFMVNADFFRARIMASLAAQVDTVLTGSMPSTPSSTPDTDGLK
jgi:hypothetical protein